MGLNRLNRSDKRHCHFSMKVVVPFQPGGGSTEMQVRQRSRSVDKGPSSGNSDSATSAIARASLNFGVSSVSAPVTIKPNHAKRLFYLAILVEFVYLAGIVGKGRNSRTHFVFPAHQLK